jgi:hypothetical protein
MFLSLGVVFPLKTSYNDADKSEFADEFLELSLFFKAFQALYSELLCIFPCFCPYGQFTRESFSECI